MPTWDSVSSDGSLGRGGGSKLISQTQPLVNYGRLSARHLVGSGAWSRGLTGRMAGERGRALAVRAPGIHINCSALRGESSGWTDNCCTAIVFSHVCKCFLGVLLINEKTLGHDAVGYGGGREAYIVV